MQHFATDATGSVGDRPPVSYDGGEVLRGRWPIPSASVIISSYNYARYLRHTIDSALNQSYAETEVIVVDDGSRDESPRIIESYGGRILPILKSNAGQASALNAGFAASRGDVILFMDSDDLLEPTAVERAVVALADPAVAKVHWSARAVDADGRRSDALIRPDLSAGDLRAAVLDGGPYAYGWPPTTHNAFARRFLEQVMPIPEPDYRICPDLYLCGLAPLYGVIARIEPPQSRWRLHQDNNSYAGDFADRIRAGADRDEACLRSMAEHCRRLNLPADTDRWRQHCWWPQIAAVVDQITRHVPPGATFILVNQDDWGSGPAIAGRTRIPFLEHRGQYHGQPADDAHAIAELARMTRELNPTHIAFVWPYLWWLDHYAGFREHLDAHHARPVHTDRLILYDLRPGRS